MNSDGAAIFDALCKGIEATVNEFKKYPLDFLSERDIQALLYSEIRKLTPELRYSYDLTEQNRRFGFKEPFYKGPFEVHPVTTEYYLYKDKKDRFDVAILSSDADKDEAIWRQPCRVGIEIKLWQPGYRDCTYLADVKKLQNYQAYLQKKFNEDERTFTGIALLFVHPNAILEMALHWITKDARWWEQPPAL
jgi:hypothetical protein